MGEGGERGHHEGGLHVQPGVERQFGLRHRFRRHRRGRQLRRHPTGGVHPERQGRARRWTVVELRVHARTGDSGRGRGRGLRGRLAILNCSFIW